jgi:hypothetical protein
MSADSEIQIEADAAALAWLESHPTNEPRVIAYEVHRCCGGGRICQVEVRDRSRHDAVDRYHTASMIDGTKIAIDRRAVARLPSRLRLTVRGLGPFKHLDLDLDSEQWGALLYD